MLIDLLFVAALSGLDADQRWKRDFSQRACLELLWWSDRPWMAQQLRRRGTAEARKRASSILMIYEQVTPSFTAYYPRIDYLPGCSDDPDHQALVVAIDYISNVNTLDWDWRVFYMDVTARVFAHDYASLLVRRGQPRWRVRLLLDRAILKEKLQKIAPLKPPSSQ